MELQLKDLGKRYGNEWVLRGVELTLHAGVLGLLGPNGAGKSTLMRLIATIMKPTAGAILWNGVDVQRFPDTLRGVLGYLPQDFGVYPNLSALEFLEYLAAVKGLDRVSAGRRTRALLDAVNLTHVARRPLSTFSGGMKQRVGIAQALLNDPALLIVDEPTAGLDPEERIRFRQLISDIAANRVVILSTHTVSDVAAIATSILILHKGTAQIHASPGAVLAAVRGKVWEWTAPATEVPRLKEQYLISSALRSGDEVRLRAIGDKAPGAEQVEPNLEDAYLYAIASPPEGKR